MNCRSELVFLLICWSELVLPNEIDSAVLYKKKLRQEAWSKALLNEAFGSRINALVSRRVADTASHDLNAKPEKRKVLAFASPALTKKINEKLQTCRYVDEHIWKLEKAERMAEARRGMKFPWTMYSFFCSFFQFSMAPKNDSICWLNSHGLRQFSCRLLECFKQMNFE